MVLGTCSFNYNYNGSYISRKDCFEVIDYFYANGGKIIDTALNYHSHDIIAEWNKYNPNNDLKIITKIWKQNELLKCFEQLKTDKIYCVMVRDSHNTELLNYVKEFQKKGHIEKVGISIYYPSCELRQDVNAFHVPCSLDFLSQIDTMLLHADVFIRSVFNLYLKIGGKIEDIQKIKEHERKDLKHEIDFVVGVDSLEQLKLNMELLK